MTWTVPRPAVVPLLVAALSCGCQAQMSAQSPGPSWAAVTGTPSYALASAHPWEDYPLANALFVRPQDARAVADRFNRTFNAGGMVAVATDVERCYSAQEAEERRQTLVLGRVRFCLLYDGTAYRADKAVRERRGWDATPYFERDTAVGRWVPRVQKAGFGRLPELDAYMVRGAVMSLPLLPTSNL